MDKETLKINEPSNKFKNFLIDIVDIIAFLVFIIGLFLAIKVFVIAPVIVKGQSMEPNYYEGEYIFIDKFYYKFNGGIKRGDVVVLMPSTSDVSFLKRVVGIPGDTINIQSGNVFLCKTEDKWVKYNNNDIYEDKFYKDGNLVCKQLRESYIEGKSVILGGYSEKIVTKVKCGISKFVLGTGQYLVFGDNRMHSTDSSCCFVGYCGTNGIYYITKDKILGKVRNLKLFSKKND